MVRHLLRRDRGHRKGGGSVSEYVAEEIRWTDKGRRAIQTLACVVGDGCACGNPVWPFEDDGWDVGPGASFVRCRKCGQRHDEPKGRA